MKKLLLSFVAAATLSSCITTPDIVSGRVTEAEMRGDIAELAKNRAVLVVYCADSVPTCGLGIYPILDAVAERYEGAVDIVRVDLDRMPEALPGQAELPYFEFYRRGQRVTAASFLPRTTDDLASWLLRATTIKHGEKYVP